MPPKPGQKTVLITGCSPGGIGYELALELHRQGFFVMATARRPEILNELSSRGLHPLELEATSEESIKALAESAKEVTRGRLDVLINNAGARYIMPASDVQPAPTLALFQTNVFLPMQLTALLLPCLIPARGIIVNIASLAAMTPYTFGSVYCASKGALVSYSRTLRSELKPFGVRVMVAMVGTVATNVRAAHNALTTELPRESLYKEVEDIYRWRVGFSQRSAGMTAGVFARDLVREVNKGEASGGLLAWLDWATGGWMGYSGTKDWWWGGGYVTSIRLLSLAGESAMDFILGRKFRVPEITQRLHAQKKQS